MYRDEPSEKGAGSPFFTNLLVAQDAEKGIFHAEHLEPNAVLWIIGYPPEKGLINYETREIKNTRSILRAVYKGASTSVHCHQMSIQSSIKLESFDGLSGSPVFYMKRKHENGEVVEYPLLVGMVLRGTASSGISRFVSSNVISNIVNLAETNA